MPRVFKMSVKQLKQMIAEEKAAYVADVSKVAKKTKEVEADEWSDTLEKDVDHLKALKIKEARLLRDLKKLREEKKKLDEVIPKDSIGKVAHRSGRPNVGHGKAPAYVDVDPEEEFFGEKLPTGGKKKEK